MFVKLFAVQSFGVYRAWQQCILLAAKRVQPHDPVVGRPAIQCQVSERHDDKQQDSLPGHPTSQDGSRDKIKGWRMAEIRMMVDAPLNPSPPLTRPHPDGIQIGQQAQPHCYPQHNGCNRLMKDRTQYIRADNTCTYMRSACHSIVYATRFR